MSHGRTNIIAYEQTKMNNSRQAIIVKPIGLAFLLMTVTGFLMLTAQKSAAATLTNADRTERTLTVIRGDTRETQIVKSGALVKDLCANGCIVRIDNDPERDFILEGRERVTIEDGLLYYDGEQAPEAQSPDKSNAR